MTKNSKNEINYKFYQQIANNCEIKKLKDIPWPLKFSSNSSNHNGGFLMLKKFE